METRKIQIHVEKYKISVANRFLQQTRKMGVLKVVIICVGFLVFLFSAISLGSDHWLKDNTGHHVIGLWKMCYKDDCRKLKDNKTEVKDWLEEVRVMMLFGCFYSVLGVTISILLLLKYEKLGCVLNGIVYGLTAIFTIAGLATYHQETKVNIDKYDMKYGWSLAFGWVSVVLCFVEIILSIVVAMRADKEAVLVIIHDRLTSV